ncbi:sorbosone dehydrogenase [Gemmobacter aquarius]|uniref:Sorbosone dehydrogenase n=1 Tax=Paragemmobacter aquarius TaxID=2169400 RepID=A0A2S0UJY3_9RHOB|nr:sorbosone dehydrogenase family protein [Gemmobacter aquarius]AWB48128.1 sorbosone dehydrogenase [Gemmobacter aquarius]
MIDRISLATALLALSALCATAQDFDPASQIGPDPRLPDPQMALMPDLRVAEVTGWAKDETPTVPEGLSITAYATDLVNPRRVYTLPNGDVLVVQARGPQGEPVSRPKDIIRGWIMSIAHGSGGGPTGESNLITLLRDTDRDGTVDERSDLLTGLNSPFGVVFADDTLYVAATDAILAYPYQLGQTTITAPPTILTPLPGGPINHHWTKDLTLSPDRKYLFASVGSNSNILENGLEAEKGRAAIWIVDRQTGAARVFASGLRNPNGLTINPETGELWTVVNERDELGPNLVPDYMTSVKEGAFYGWPWSYYGQHVDPRVYPERPDMVKAAIPPDYALSSHVAPLGMVFSYASALPEQWRSGAFVGEHGSWNRDVYNGYRVVYIPFKNGKPDGIAQEVVGGFVADDKARGRPVGLGIDGTGALLVADDAGNTVWRIAAADGTISPEPMGTDQAASAPAQGQQGTDQIAGQTAGQTGTQPPEPTMSAPSPATGEPAQTEIAPATLPKSEPAPADQP